MTGQAEDDPQEMRVVLVDVIPHLLSYLLMITIPKNREYADLAYKVSVGLLQGYLKQSQLLRLPNEFVFLPLKNFISDVVCETAVTEHSYQYIYTCLTLLNMILIKNVQPEQVPAPSLPSISVNIEPWK